MRPFLFALALTLTSLAPGRTASTFTGIITDSECTDADHRRMRMGDTDAECAKACVDAHGASFMLFDGKVAYRLSDQKASAALAGQKVTITGTLDEKTKTISVDSIAASK